MKKEIKDQFHYIVKYSLLKNVLLNLLVFGTIIIVHFLQDVLFILKKLMKNVNKFLSIVFQMDLIVFQFQIVINIKINIHVFKIQLITIVIGI